jgi:Holliday junction resolvase RusA-like endonuclease
MVQMKKVAEFTVQGKPVPMPRPRLGYGRVYLPARLAAYKDAIAWAARPYFPEPLAGQVGVAVNFGLRGKGDIDNLIKSVLDALNGVIYRDDSQVVWLQTELQRGGDEYTTITIYTVDDTE